MVAVLRIVCDYDCEESLGDELALQAAHEDLPDLKSLQARYLTPDAPPEIPLRQHAVADYDQLLTGQWMQQEVCHG